jgi:UPF0176 protein
MTYQVLLFYKYVTIEDPQALMVRFRALAEQYSLKGRAILAEEGINATVEGLTADTESFINELLEDPRLANMDVKRSVGTGATFPKLSVKVRDEIVGTHFPQELADPRVRTAPHLKPEELRAMYENDDDFVVVDMRNEYEIASGKFPNTVSPGLQNSRDLPQALPSLEPFKQKKVVTVCTGGVRCEKMSAYLLSNGFEDVYQLDGGIHSYMEKYPGKDFLGTLYTFDQRHTMDFGGEREVIGICMLCDAKTENYVDCANLDCHIHFLACNDCTDENGSACCSALCTEKLSLLATAQSVLTT